MVASVDSGSAIEIHVIDTGIGIRPEDQPLLFKAFTQVGTATGHPDGTGLGLHLSRMLADLVGGSIRMASEFGRGSTFTLSLPRT
jgi:protein-histidine pros-kinase